MFGAGANPFDPARLAELMNPAELSKLFDLSALKGFDQSSLYEAQKRNMEALVAAQKAAASGYQDLFEKQVAVFQETMKAAQSQIAALSRAEPGPEAAKKQAELTAKAFETAVSNAQALAEAAQRANAEAYSHISARIEESLAELTGKAGGKAGGRTGGKSGR